MHSCGECQNGNVEDMNILQFFKVDFKKKQLWATRTNLKERVTKIRTLELSDA